VVSTHLKKYESKWESSPNRGEKNKYLKPPPSLLSIFPLKPPSLKIRSLPLTQDISISPVVAVKKGIWVCKRDTSIRNSNGFVKKTSNVPVEYMICTMWLRIYQLNNMKTNDKCSMTHRKKTFPTNQHKCNLETIAGAVFGSTSGKSSGVPGDGGCDSMTYVHMIS